MSHSVRPASGTSVAAVAAVLLTGCGMPQPVTFPHPTASAVPVPSNAPGLRAGFGRADITPPPGVGLMGYGPEGKRAMGYRHRLYARALVMEDPTGERVALVALDLPQTSMLLHRTVAKIVVETTGIGADRIILAPTHTHAGPGHFFGMRAYNVAGSSVTGFDQRMVDFLATRIARAVIEAAAGIRAAKAAWGDTAVWIATKNRSEAPFRENPPDWQVKFPVPDFLRESGHIDTTFALLRVDLRDPTSGEYRPAGAFTIFAMHGTGNPPANDLLDGDIHAIMERRLEAHIDALNGRDPSFRPEAVYLVANGAEGDVSPDMSLGAACQVPYLTRVRRPSGPRSPPGPEMWIPPGADSTAQCIAQGRKELNVLGDTLGAVAIALFDSLEPELTADVPIRRVFRTVTLPEPEQPEGLCDPRPGTATVAGASDRPTRYLNWRILGTIEAGFSQGGAAAVDSSGCQAQKRQFLGGFQEPLLRYIPLPEIAQLSVVRIGHAIVGATPFEATTVAGGRIRQAMVDTAAANGATDPLVFLIGLANGYNQYLATAEEYALQHYEGASTLYGPRTAARVERLMADLTALLPLDEAPSPTVDVPEIEGVPGPDTYILPPPDAGPPPDRIQRRVAATWADSTLVIRWNDEHPGRLVPADGPVLRIDEETTDGWAIRTWDDDRHLEVRALRAAGKDGYRWEARWSPKPPPTQKTRVVLLRRSADLPEIVSADVPPPFSAPAPLGQAPAGRPGLRVKVPAGSPRDSGAVAGAGGRR